MISALILSGGASTRMGRPKALLPLGKTTFVERLFTLFSHFAAETLILTGAHHREIAEALPGLVPYLVENPRHALGQFSSLQAGLARCREAERILFTPVDFAAIQTETIAALLAAPEHDVVKPRCEGRSGHPVLISRRAADALLAAPMTANAKAILSPLDALYLDVTDRGTIEDTDTPEDYERLLASWGPTA